MKTEVLIFMQKSMRLFLTCVVLNVGPHDFYISFWFISLFMDYVFSIDQVVKKKCKRCYVDFLFYICCYLLRGFPRARVSARPPSGSPQLSQRMKFSCASEGVSQCPVSLGSPRGIWHPALDIAAHPAVHEECRVPRVGFRTGSKPSGEIPKLALRKS